MLCALVQHHPSRAHLLPALRERLVPLPTQVVTDPQPDSFWPFPWRSYRACLEAFPDDASHALIVQDDAMPCRDLAAALPAVIAAAQRYTRDDPLIVLALYNETDAAERAWVEEIVQPQTAPAFVELSCKATFVPLVATIWPRAAADALLAVAPVPYMGWGTRPGAPPGPEFHPWVSYIGDGTLVFMDRDDYFKRDVTVELGRLDKHDDVVVFRHRDVLPPIICVLPALVSHDDHGVSIEAPGKRGYRRTALYVGDDASALDLFPAILAAHGIAT